MREAGKKPNVVFIITDDQGYPPLGAHGHPFVSTPALDGFRGESVSFDQFHTGTTCAPTRAGLLTGRYCNSTGVWHTIGGRSLLRDDEWTLAGALKENGYRTGMFGKWHLGDEYPYRPQDRGFETAVYHGGGGVGQQPDWWGNDYFNDTYYVDGRAESFSGYCTDVWFAEALKFICKNSGEPFFCYISTNAPHSPFNVEPAYRDIYYRKKTDCEFYARFLGMITNIDENFALFRKKLAELGLEHNTILVFMSDNGQTKIPNPETAIYNAGMRGMKGDPYEGGHRVPFFLRWPAGGIQSGRQAGELAAYIDVMPTLLELCGIKIAGAGFHGESLAPLLYGKGGEMWHDRVLVTDTQRVAYPLKWRLSCVMKNRWRLVNGKELYNLEEDFSQRIDVSGAHPGLVGELRDAYEKWWELCSARIGEETPIYIGAAEGAATALRTFDLRNELGHGTVWNQGQVRKGVSCHGWWEIKAVRAGVYEFELRRWPMEAGHGITDAIEGADVDYYRDGISPNAEASYTGGRALLFDTACLDISGMGARYAKVGTGESGVVFRVKLEKKDYRVRARFSCSAGGYSSAYYVYVRFAG